MQRLALAWRRDGTRIGFVPTMGYLHAGHLSLVKKAKELVGPSSRVVLSIYVNPTQFGPHEDFSRYPRDFRGDASLCRNGGVDVLFAPTDKEMYCPAPLPKFSTYVVEESLSGGMEGASRPGHFRGVTTIVAKLFNIVQPDLAVFGAKDFQQAAVVRRMVRDLNFPVKVIVSPTLREPDGLAMSSRNKYLHGALRAQATVLWRAAQKVKRALRQSSGALRSQQMKSNLKRFIEAEPDAKMDYVEFFDPETLKPVREISRGTHMALAVFIGKTRLIDNGRID